MAETRFNVSSFYVKGQSNKLYALHQKKRFSCSGLIAIERNRMFYSTLVRGKVTAELYDVFLNHLIKELKNKETIVFWIDNARIDEHAKDQKHKVIYNAPYSPEMNPIENILGIWNEKITQVIFKFNSEA